MTRQITCLLFSAAVCLAALTGGLALAAGASAETSTLADPLALYGEQARYVVYRDGERVGRHTVSFSRSDTRLQVTAESALTVRVLKIPVYRFSYESLETWQDGQLQSVVSRVNDNGDRRTLSLRNEGRQSLLRRGKRKQRVARLQFTSNHWLRGAVSAGRLFNTLNGKASRVAVETLGPQTIATVSGQVEAHGYRYTGGIRAVVWYDRAGRWVGLEFNADDGSEVVYRADF